MSPMLRYIDLSLAVTLFGALLVLLPKFVLACCKIGKRCNATAEKRPADLEM